MEALSIQPVKANQRPAGTQARSALGGIFQTLLQDNLQQQDASVAPPRADARPESRASQNDRPGERIGGTVGDQRDRPYDNDINFDDRDTAGAVESRRASSDTPVHKQESPKDDGGTPAAGHSDEGGQSPDNRGTEEITAAVGSNAPAPNGTPGTKEQIASVSGVLQTASNPAIPNAAQVPITPNSGDSGQAIQTNGVSGQAGSTPTAAAAASAPINQARTPAPSQSTTAPAAGASTTPTASTPAGSNGPAVQVTVTQQPVVATPNANMGGGTATAAIASASNPETTTTAAPNTQAAAGAAQGTPSPVTNNQSAPASTGHLGTSSNTPIAPADGQPAAARPANAAAAPVQGENTHPVNAQPRNGATQSGLVAETPVQNGPVETSPNRSAPASNAATQGGTGLNGSTKIANAQNQHTQGATQGQPDQAAKAATQNPATANPQSAAAHVAQAGAAQSVGQTGPSARAGSSNPTDTASSRVSNVSTIAPSGFAQAMTGAPDTLGSLTRSGGTRPNTSTQVAVEIQKAVTAGKDQIRIRLHPAELGQIDVSLKVRNDGTVKVHVTTERIETFDLMQRDSRALERALQDAGLKTDSNSLNFNLRGGDQHSPNNGQRGHGLTAQSNPDSDRTAEGPPPEADTPAPVVSNRALDIRV